VVLVQCWQNHHFGKFAKEKIPYAIERYVNETKRLYGVLNKQLIGQNMLQANIQLRIWQSYHGFCVMNGNKST
jgi:glutathione S-transferase